MEREQPRESTMSLSKVIGYLEKLDTEFRNEIPTDIINGVAEEDDQDPPNWKVRKNWWQGAINALGFAKNFLNSHKHSALITKIDSFNKTYLADEFKDRLTTSDDINKANAIMRETAETLKKLQNDV